MKKPVLLLLLVAGCASDPIVDRKGLNEVKYRQDLAECRTYAEEVSTAKEAAERGAVGVAVGAVFGSIIGNSSTAGRVAGAGAVSGGTGGALSAEERKELIVFRCLKGRGYRILG